MNYRRKARRVIEHKMMMMTVESFHTADRQTDIQTANEDSRLLAKGSRQARWCKQGDGANKTRHDYYYCVLGIIIFSEVTYPTISIPYPYHIIPWHTISSNLQ